MKAKEYLDKYGDAVWEEWRHDEVKTDGAFAKLYIEFFCEMRDIIKMRNVKFDRAIFPIIDEQNKKWNALCNLFIKKYGYSPIAENAFKQIVEKELLH